MKKYFKILIILIVLLLNNFIWYNFYTKEKVKFKQAIIPSLTDDFFTNQLILSILYDQLTNVKKYYNLNNSFFHF